MRLMVSLATLFVASAAFAAEPGTSSPPPPAGQSTSAQPANPHAGVAGAPTLNMTPPPAAKLTPQDVKDVFYALGTLLGKNLSDGFSPTKDEWAEVKKGVDDQANGKALRVKFEDVQAKVKQLNGERAEAKKAVDLKKNEGELAKYAKEPGATKLPSGVIITHVKPGTGPQPTADDTVTVNYRGTTTDGKEFDSSYKRNKPIDFPLKGVVKCWTDGVAAMKVGEKAKLVCPSELAYGERPPPQSGIPPNSILIFEVELLSIKGK